MNRTEALRHLARHPQARMWDFTPIDPADAHADLQRLRLGGAPIEVIDARARMFAAALASGRAPLDLAAGLIRRAGGVQKV